MLITVISATTEPLTLEEAKQHLRVDLDFTADDARISALITSAREVVEQFTGRALADAGYRWASEGGAPWILPLWPAQVTGVSYLSSVGRADVTDYVFDADRSLLSGLPYGASAVTVEFETDAGDVPEALKSAIKLRISAEYEASPEQKAVLIEASNNLAWSYRLSLGV